MKCDDMMCKRIMLQLVQNGHFVSETLEEAYHAALLKDNGYVDAKIETDNLGTPTKVTIGRMTANGHDALEREFSPVSVTQSAGISPDEYYKILVANKHDNETSRDKMLATISTGGIGLLFAIVSYLKTNKIDVPLLPWLITLSLWASVLIGLLISDHIGGKAIDKSIEKLYDEKSDVMHNHMMIDRVTHFLNSFNCIAVMAGVGTFTWFIIKIV